MRGDRGLERCSGPLATRDRLLPAVFDAKRGQQTAIRLGLLVQERLPLHQPSLVESRGDSANSPVTYPIGKASAEEAIELLYPGACILAPAFLGEQPLQGVMVDLCH